MALRRPVGERAARLDPVRWPGALRRANLLRGGLVAGLLATAAGVLYAGAPPARCDTGRVGPSASASPGGTGSSPTSADPAGGTGPPAHPGRPGDAVASGGSGGNDLPAGTVGVAVALAEPAVLEVLRPGDRVDLLAAPLGSAPRPADAGEATTVAENVLVLATPGGPDPAAGGVYLALAPRQARVVVALPPDTRLAVLVRA